MLWGLSTKTVQTLNISTHTEQKLYNSDAKTVHKWYARNVQNDKRGFHQRALSPCWLHLAHVCADRECNCYTHTRFFLMCLLINMCARAGTDCKKRTRTHTPIPSLERLHRLCAFLQDLSLVVGRRTVLVDSTTIMQNSATKAQHSMTIAQHTAAIAQQ